VRNADSAARPHSACGRPSSIDCGPPLSIQIYGSNAERRGEAARIV